MARDDSWSRCCGGLAPSGRDEALGALGGCLVSLSVVTEAAVGAGHWPPGRRAGPGRVDEAPRPTGRRPGASTGSAILPRRDNTATAACNRTSSGCKGRACCASPAPRPCCARTPTPAARHLERLLIAGLALVQGHEHPPVQACFHCRGDGPRRAVGPAPPAAADGTRDRQRILYRRVLCPLGGPGRAAAQAEDRRRVGPGHGRIGSPAAGSSG